MSNTVYTDAFLKTLWKEFADVPIKYDNEHPDGALESDWFVFEADTERMDIWHWFDEHYSDGVYTLMFPEDAGKNS